MPINYNNKYNNYGVFKSGILIKIIILIIAITFLSGCAVFDKSRPGWDKFVPLSVDEKIPLHYETVGSGKAVILIHGFAANTYTWRYLTPVLSKTHKVYMLDLKGFGKSPKPDDGAYSLYDQAKLVLDFIQQQNLNEVTLIGHSYGGGVSLVSALFLTKSMPGVLNKLVLIDSVAYPQDTPFFINILATPLLGTFVANVLPVRFQVRNVLKKAYYNDDLITEEAIDAYAQPLHSAEARIALLTTARQIFPTDLTRLSQEFPKIKVPTKIIWGQYDEIVPGSIGKKLHHAIDSSSFKLIESCGHNPQEECPELTVPIILEFLQ